MRSPLFTTLPATAQHPAGGVYPHVVARSSLQEHARPARVRGLGCECPFAVACATMLNVVLQTEGRASGKGLAATLQHAAYIALGQCQADDVFARIALSCTSLSLSLYHAPQF